MRGGVRTGIGVLLGLAIVSTVQPPCPAIEMFTYFGDGSRIGLPSLEVPIEAYPGIPLRSDRLRARRRAQRAGPGTAVRVGPGTPQGGITIRSMPTIEAPRPLSSAPPRVPAPARGTVRQPAGPGPSRSSRSVSGPPRQALPARPATGAAPMPPLPPEPATTRVPVAPEPEPVPLPLAEPR